MEKSENSLNQMEETGVAPEWMGNTWISSNASLVKMQRNNKRAQNIFFETCREFEMAKRTIKPQSDIKFRVRIPFELGETYAKVYPGENLRSKETVLTKKGHQFTFSFKRDKLEMASKDAEKFFEKCINKINDHLKNLFRLKNG